MTTIEENIRSRHTSHDQVAEERLAILLGSVLRECGLPPRRTHVYGRTAAHLTYDRREDADAAALLMTTALEMGLVSATVAPSDEEYTVHISLAW